MLERILDTLLQPSSSNRSFKKWRMQINCFMQLVFSISPFKSSTEFCCENTRWLTCSTQIWTLTAYEVMVI
jgi:hypothetical protein